LPIERVFLKPDGVRAYPDALRAILEADIVVAGPGSLFTSILPNLLVEDIVRAIRASGALKVYICNVATQKGETDGYNLGDHVEAIERHAGKGLFHYILANDNFSVELPPHLGIELVPLVYDEESGYEVVTGDVIDPDMPWRHDSKKLSKLLMKLYRSYIASAISH
jgi:uncharacterized cofD-like protein